MKFILIFLNFIVNLIKYIQQIKKNQGGYPIRPIFHIEIVSTNATAHTFHIAKIHPNKECFTNN